MRRLCVDSRGTRVICRLERHRCSVGRRKLLRRLARGSLENVAFDELVRLVEGLGFELRRVRGSHHIFVHPEVAELLNLQEVKGQAKPYQIRQLLRLIVRYALTLEDDL